MNAIMRALGSDAFKAATMTDKYVDLADYKPGYVTSLGLATKMPIATDDFVIGQEESGELRLLQTVERGAELKQLKGRKRNLRTFTTERLGEETTIWGYELKDLLVDQSQSMVKKLQAEFADRQRRIEDNISLTMENWWLGCIQGIVLDADGSQIYNWFDEWGITPAAEIPFDLANATIEQQQTTIRQMKRSMARAQKGMRWTGRTIGLMGDDFADRFLSNPEINKTYLNQQEAAQLRGDVQPFATVDRFGVTWVNYRGTDDNSTVAVAPDKVKFFPADKSSDMYRHVLSPHAGLNELGKKGKERYTFTGRDKSERQEWISVALETFPMLVNMRPEMLRSGRMGA